MADITGKTDWFSGMDQDFIKNGLAGITNEQYGAFSPSEKLSLSSGYNTDQNSGMFGDLGSTLGQGFDFLGGMSGITGLADMYMNWDKLQSTKASTRDSHNALADQVNNNRARRRSVSNSLGLAAPSNPGKDIRQSSV